MTIGTDGSPRLRYAMFIRTVIKTEDLVIPITEHTWNISY